MQHYFEKSNDMSSFSGSDRERSYPVSPQISERRKLSVSNGQLSDFILQFNKNDEGQFNDFIIREEYMKIQDPLGQSRNYAKSVTKRRTPISFKVRLSSCQKTREQQELGSYVYKNNINLLNAKDNNGCGSKTPSQNHRITFKEDVGAKQLLQDKKILILPQHQEHGYNNFQSENMRNLLKDRVNTNSPDRGNTNSPILNIQKETQYSLQQRNNGDFTNKSKTEMLRQNRVKKKLIDSSFLTGKREANLTANSMTITTTSRLKNSITPILEMNENTHITQKMIQSVNPRTLPFLSTERGIINSHLFPQGEIKTCTAKGTDSFLNHILPISSKNYQSNHQTSQSVTTTISYNTQGVNTTNNQHNKVNVNQFHHNTISTNQTIKSRSSRYSSNTPSKRKNGIFTKALDENEFGKECIKITSRNSQLRRQQYNAKQNNILVNSLQNGDTDTQDNITSISLTPNTIGSTSENNKSIQNSLKSKCKPNHLLNSPIQQAFNKTQFNKIIVNFSTLKKEGKEIGKGLFGSILNNIPKHPLFQQISLRQSNNHNGIHQIGSLLEKSSEQKIISPQLMPYLTESQKKLQSVELLVQKINSKFIELQGSLTNMESQNKVLLDAIEQDKNIDILKYLEEHQTSKSSPPSLSYFPQDTKDQNKIEISQIIPLLKQCFNSSNNLNNTSSYSFLQTDADDQDSEQEEIATA